MISGCFRYCQADDRLLEAVKFLDLGNGAGWELLQVDLTSETTVISTLVLQGCPIVLWLPICGNLSSHMILLEQAMLNRDYRQRPIAEAILNHPFMTGNLL